METWLLQTTNTTSRRPVDSDDLEWPSRLSQLLVTFQSETARTHVTIAADEQSPGDSWVSRSAPSSGIRLYSSTAIYTPRRSKQQTWSICQSPRRLHSRILLSWVVVFLFTTLRRGLWTPLPDGQPTSDGRIFNNYAISPPPVSSRTQIHPTLSFSAGPFPPD